MFTYDEDKFIEAILLIAEIQGEGAKKTKVAKTLFYADFISYKNSKRPITGSKYINLKNGPVPANYQSVFSKLKREGTISIKKSGKYQIIIPRKKPNRQAFTNSELETLLQIAEDIKPLTSTQISDYSHEFIGWQISKIGEYINYEIIDMIRVNEEKEGDDPPQYEECDYIEKALFSEPGFVNQVARTIERYKDGKSQ